MTQQLSILTEVALAVELPLANPYACLERLWNWSGFTRTLWTSKQEVMNLEIYQYLIGRSARCLLSVTLGNYLNLSGTSHDYLDVEYYSYRHETS